MVNRRLRCHGGIITLVTAHPTIPTHVFAPESVHDGGGDVVDGDGSLDRLLALLPVREVSPEAAAPIAVQIPQIPVFVTDYVRGSAEKGKK